MSHEDVDLDCMFDDDAKYKKEMEIIVPTIIKVTKLCMEYRNSPDFGKETKEDASPVTVADICSQILINKMLMENFPNDLIIAEEDMNSIVNDEMKEKIDKWLGFKDWKRYLEINPPVDDGDDCHENVNKSNGHDDKRFWTIDPIDGTRGYINDGQFCICIALVVDRRVVLSAINCPVLKSGIIDEGLGALFLAIDGHGVFEVHVESQQWHRLAFKKLIDSFENKKLAEAFSPKHASHVYSNKIIEYFNMNKESVKMDGQGKYCVVLREEAVMYFRRPSNETYREKIWDHVPGILLIREAGGRVFDRYGNDIELEPKTHLNVPGKIIIASFANEKMIGELVKCINSICP